MESISMASLAWFLGFFPLFDIYIAVPVAMGAGFDPVSAVLWAAVGNFMAVPTVTLFYRQLERVSFFANWMEKLAANRFRGKIEQYGGWFILLLAPIAGVWAIAVIARAIGMSKRTLFLSTGTSILIYGIVIGGSIQLGLGWF